MGLGVAPILIFQSTPHPAPLGAEPIGASDGWDISIMRSYALEAGIPDSFRWENEMKCRRISYALRAALAVAMLHTVTCFGQRPGAEIVHDAGTTAELARTGAGRAATEAALSQYALSRSAVDAGNVVAVQNGRSEVLTEATIASHADAGAIFVERVRPQPTRETVPPSLASQSGGGGPPGAVLPPPQTALKLGYQVSTRTSSGAVVKLDAWAREGSGLSLDGSKSAYVGDFFVALVNSQQPVDHSPLAPALSVAITAIGAQAVSPEPFTIDALGKWTKASIVVRSVPGERYAVSVSADPNGKGDSLELSVTRPLISLSARSPSIVGWGIGQSTIDVRVSGMLNPDGQQVLLTGTGGVTLEPVTLNAVGSGSTQLRSTRAAMSQIQAIQPEGQSNTLSVSFTPPWLFLAMAFLGGLAGAFLRGRGRQRWLMALAIGALSAIVMTLAYAVGVDWPSRLPGLGGLAGSGEAVVFVLGAIAALVGVSALVKPASTT
jgi:hypothetical protein